MRIIIQIEGCKPENRKEIVKSIKGFAKSLAKRFGFRMEFKEMQEGSRHDRADIRK